MKARLILAALLALMVASCGKHVSEHGHGQVAAKVNGHEITVLQVNSMLGRLGKVPASQSTQATDHVVKNLVDQELLVQQAIKKKLDRNPQVLQTILESRKQILAQAYLAGRFDTLPTPTGSAITDFYNTHSDLFAHRAVYRLESIIIQGGKSKTPAIRSELTKSRTPTAFMAWLKNQGVPFRNIVMVRTAEQLPFPMLKQLSTMKVGQTIMVRDGANLAVLVVLAKADRPLTLAQSRDAIKQFLVNQARQTMVKQTLRKLHAKAKIHYFGAYAGAANVKTNVKTSATTPPEKTKAATTGSSSLDIGKALQ